MNSFLVFLFILTSLNKRLVLSLGTYKVTYNLTFDWNQLSPLQIDSEIIGNQNRCLVKCSKTSNCESAVLDISSNSCRLYDYEIDSSSIISESRFKIFKKIRNTVEINIGTVVWDVQVLRNGLIALARDDNILSIYNISSMNIQKSFIGHIGTLRAVVQLNNEDIVTGSYDYSIIIWNLTTGEMKKRMTGHSFWVLSLDVVDTDLVISASCDQTAKLWNTSSGSMIRDLRGHSQYVHSVATITNTTAATGSYDKTIIIWNLTNAQIIARLTDHTDKVLRVIKIGNNLLASGSADRTIRIWSLDTYNCLRVLKGHTGDVYSLALLNNGYLVSGSSDDDPILVWNLKSGIVRRKYKTNSIGILSLSSFYNDGFIATSNHGPIIKTV